MDRHVHWFGEEQLDLGWAPIDQPPLDAVYYEFERDGLVVTRRRGYRPDPDAGSPDTGRPPVADC